MEHLLEHVVDKCAYRDRLRSVRYHLDDVLDRMHFYNALYLFHVILSWRMMDKQNARSEGARCKRHNNETASYLTCRLYHHVTDVHIRRVRA